MLTVDHLENKYLVSFYNISKLNVLNYKEIGSQLMPLVSQPGSNLTLNFSGIRFVDSSGFQVLLDLYRTSKINNSNMEMINISEDLVELIKLVELEQVFQLN